MALIANEIPAVVRDQGGRARALAQQGQLTRSRPELVIWECDAIVYHAGWLQARHRRSGAARTSGVPLRDARERRCSPSTGPASGTNEIDEAIEYAARVRVGPAHAGGSARWFTAYPGRPDYFTHWGEAFRYAASVMGLPVGDYPHCRPPQAILPDEAKVQIRAAYEEAGLTAGAAPGQA